MAAEEVLKLFDSYWFEHDIFAGKQMLSASTTKPIQQNHDNEVEDAKLSDMAKFQGRSYSDRYLRYETSFTPNDSSPTSVISTTPKLQKILSGKEICESSNEEVIVKQTKAPVKKKMSTKKRRKGISRSLSELEFEEVKGFMELGFVFTEEDKTSSLVSIIPGLQRWGQDGGEQKSDECTISRPYLSEAWEVLDQRKANRQLMKWKFPALPNENNIKDHLKAWAQTVASTVR